MHVILCSVVRTFYILHFTSYILRSTFYVADGVALCVNVLCSVGPTFYVADGVALCVNVLCSFVPTFYVADGVALCVSVLCSFVC